MKQIFPRKQLLILLAFVSAYSFAACRKASTPAEQTQASPPAISEQYQHPQGGTTPAGETRYFKGSIGSALGLQMKLTREGEKLSGTYFYQKIGARIDLRGTLDGQGNLMLEEFDQGGKQTGIFKGIWKTDEVGLVGIAGNWTRPNGDRQTAFSLHEEPIELTGGVEIVARQIKENNKKLRYEIAVEYPQLSGASNASFDKFNQAVKNLVNSRVNEFKKGMVDPEREVPPDGSMGSDLGIGYTIALARDDLVSIQFTLSSYESGAAHPNSSSEVLNFDLKNGKALKLGDLFNPGARYLAAISTYCIRDLKRQSKERGADAMLEDEQIQNGAAANPKNYKSWTVTKRSLGITFDSYQVAPYAAGPQQVSIPYSALKEVIKADGPVGQFVK